MEQSFSNTHILIILLFLPFIIFEKPTLVIPSSSARSESLIGFVLQALAAILIIMAHGSGSDLDCGIYSSCGGTLRDGTLATSFNPIAAAYLIAVSIVVEPDLFSYALIDAADVPPPKAIATISQVTFGLSEFR